MNEGKRTANGHLLYVVKDFTDEEYFRNDPVAVDVIDGGISICKVCGAAGWELDFRVCGVRQEREAKNG